MSTVRATTLAATVLSLAVGGCLGRTPVKLDPRDPYGVVLTLHTRWGKFPGVELIACDTRFLFVYERPRARWGRIPWRDVYTDRIDLERDTSAIGGTAVVGTISTLSHGFVLIVTAPVWLLAGGIISASAVDQKVALPADGAGACRSVAPYTRFPAGLPPSMYARFNLSP